MTITFGRQFKFPLSTKNFILHHFSGVFGGDEIFRMVLVAFLGSLSGKMGR
jgi:hypothetical protein